MSNFKEMKKEFEIHGHMTFNRMVYAIAFRNYLKKSKIHAEVRLLPYGFKVEKVI